MSVGYKDYYSVLGVDRAAPADEIKKAYRKLVRELHPDVNKSAAAGERIREVNEAYEVLSDEEKRRRYDELGSDWREGAPFSPPPGWGGFSGSINVEDLGSIFGEMGGGRSRAGRSSGGFSDFFEMLFGGMAGTAAGGGAGGYGQQQLRRGRDLEMELEVRLIDLLEGGQRRLEINVPDGTGGRPRSIAVNLPKGLRGGQKLRLAGKGGAAPAGGEAGDLYLRIKVAHEPGFTIEGNDLLADLDVAAPLAVVGGTVSLPTPQGPVALRIAPGTQPGTVLRIRGRGLPTRDDDRGDIRARVRVTVPKHPSHAERELYEKLADLTGDRGR